MTANVRRRRAGAGALAVACLIAAAAPRGASACSPDCPASVELPAAGPGFVAIGRSDRRFGTARLIYGLQDSARDWNAGAVKPGGAGRLAINEISQLCGGRIGNHSSHQCGTDVDIGPLRLYPHHGYINFYDDFYYSPELTNWYIKVTARNRLPLIKVFFNDARLHDALVRPWPNHDNHFHARIQAPPEAAQCCARAGNCGP